MSTPQDRPEWGARPELVELPVERISVDPRYQRDTGSARSRHLIDKIAAHFRWPRFGAILVVRVLKADGGGWHVIDGQHRLEAVRVLGIQRVPAIELPHQTIEEAAADFVAINRDRVVVTPLHIHHAMLRAGEPTALAVDRACGAAGIEICRYPVPAKLLKPGQTLAVGTIRRLIEKVNEDWATRVLRGVVREHGTRPGAINAAAIRSSAATTPVPASTSAGAAPRSDNQYAKPKAQGDVKFRSCLSCRQPFKSSGIGERVCPNCKSTSAWRGASIE